jgi:hypothetical protein
MENNFKGTSGEWKLITTDSDDFQHLFVTQVESNSCICQIQRFGFGLEWLKEAEANMQLIRDAGNIRQQINCDFPELLERFKAMETVLAEFEIVTRHYKFSSDHEFVKDRAKQLLTQKTVIE